MDEKPERGAEGDKAGWIERLAERSSGLPKDQPAKSDPDATGSYWAMAGIGFEFAGTVAIFAVMGYYLDRWMGWSPWGTVVLTLIGFVGGLYLLIKQAMRWNK